MENKTYIIIVTYNGMKWLERALSSIPVQYPIIIVDNASTDFTCDFVKRNYPDIQVLKQHNNLGFGQANNLGISIALNQGASHVFLMNQDVYLNDNSIEILHECAALYPEYGILSPIHFNGEGDSLDHNFSNYVSNKKQPHFFADALKRDLKGVYPVPFVNAAAWYIPEKTLKTIGGFDPIFFHYGEDDNYAQRAAYHKIKIGVVSKSIIYHDREERIVVKEEPFSKAYLKKRETHYKVKLANLNEPDMDSILSNSLYLLRRKVVTNTLKLRLERARGYKKELSLLKIWAKDIKLSRKQNMRRAAHYLTIENL